MSSFLKKPLVIGIGSSIDGRAALWSVECSKPNGFDYYESTYNRTPPYVKGKEVIVVGFCYNKRTILEMAQEAEKITILDHRISTADEFDRIVLPKNVTLVLDQKHSACVSAWLFFNPNKKIPKILQIFEDRQQWKFEFTETKPVISALLSEGFLNQELHSFFNEMDSLATDEIGAIMTERLYREGKPIERYKSNIINSMIQSGKRYGKIANFLVPIINAPTILASEIGEQLLLESNYPFSASYFDNLLMRRYELRSRENSDVDVSKIAREFGGGGLRNSAGFTVPFDHPLIVTNHYTG